MNTKRLLPALIAALGFGAAQAQITVQYYFDAVENTPPTAADGIAGGVGSLTVASHSALTSANLTASSAINMGGTHFTGWNSSPFIGNGHVWSDTRDGGPLLSGVYRTSTNDGGNLNSTLGAGPTVINDFISFSITNNSGSAYTITDFNFAVGFNLRNAAGLNFYADILVNGSPVWNAASDSAVKTINYAATPLNNGFDNLSVSIPNGQTAEFRVFATKNQTSGSQLFYVANMEAVVIPEPGTLVLVGIALGSVFFFRRRR